MKTDWPEMMTSVTFSVREFFTFCRRTNFTDHAIRVDLPQCFILTIAHFDLVRHAEPVHVIVRTPSGDLTLTSFKVSSVVNNF
jgi:hypothetical protein